MVVPLSAALDTASCARRGGRSSPRSRADYVVDWAVRSPPDRVFEPSCGEAAFLTRRGDASPTLRGGGPRAPARPARRRRAARGRAAPRAAPRRAGVAAQIRSATSSPCPPTGSYDAVIGNPPYVRYQDFSGEARARAREAALRAGVPLTGLASSWAAFTVHAALFLSPAAGSGWSCRRSCSRVNYAAEVRRFLMQRFGRVRLVLFTERVFPGVLEEVVLLLAEASRQGAAPTTASSIQVRERRCAGTSSTGPRTRCGARPARAASGRRRCCAGAAGRRTQRCAGDGPSPTCRPGATRRSGMVTGNNSYFALSPAARRRARARARGRCCGSPRRARRHLRGLNSRRTAALRRARRSGAADAAVPAGRRAVRRRRRRYIAAGERAGVHQAYKCRVRTPWWRVPLCGRPTCCSPT